MEGFPQWRSDTPVYVVSGQSSVRVDSSPTSVAKRSHSVFSMISLKLRTRQPQIMRVL